MHKSLSIRSWPSTNSYNILRRAPVSSKSGTVNLLNEPVSEIIATFNEKRRNVNNLVLRPI